MFDTFTNGQAWKNLKANTAVQMMDPQRSKAEGCARVRARTLLIVGSWTLGPLTLGPLRLGPLRPGPLDLWILELSAWTLGHLALLRPSNPLRGWTLGPCDPPWPLDL